MRQRRRIQQRNSCKYKRIWANIFSDFAMILLWSWDCGGIIVVDKERKMGREYG